MKRLINLNSRPLDGTSARGPPLTSQRSNGLHRILVWTYGCPQKHWHEGPSYEFAMPLLKNELQWRLYASYQSKFAAMGSHCRARIDAMRVVSNPDTGR
jgi:hypothetical protein